MQVQVFGAVFRVAVAVLIIMVGMTQNGEVALCKMKAVTLKMLTMEAWREAESGDNSVFV